MKTFLLLNTKIEGRWQKQHEFPHLQNIGIVFVFLHSASVERKKKIKSRFWFLQLNPHFNWFLLRTEVVTLLTGLLISITHSWRYILQRTKLQIKIHTFLKSEYFHCEQTGELTTTAYSRSLFTLTKWQIDLHSLKTDTVPFIFTQPHCPESESESL